MSIVIDFGNTLKKIAFFENNSIKALYKDKELSVEMFKKWIVDNNIEENNCILSNVSEVDNDLLSYLKSNFHFIHCDISTPVPLEINYQSQNTLGFDRIAAAVYAKSLYPDNNILCIMAGSCITQDFIHKEKGYIGGSISPGINMRLQSMHNLTFNLPLIEADSTAIFHGNDTKSSLLSGAIGGSLLEIESRIRMYKADYHDLKVVLGGGDAFYFDKYLKISIFANSNLVFYGLNKILEFNVNKKN